MNILVLGGGGREHALAWAIAQNPKCGQLIVAPGNAGMGDVAQLAPGLDILDGAAVLDFAFAHAVDFVVVGPEAPLAAGVADALRAGGVLVLGPSAAAARLEASKAFTKEICAAAGVPTAAWAVFDAAAPARAHVEAAGAPIVVKADGLAAGKGVTVAGSVGEALAAVDAAFADGGARVVIEECMTGEEASVFVLVDGETVLLLGTAQDHKRAFDGDRGPNTGGMGAYSPAPVVSDAVLERTMAEIVRPTLAELARRGTPYRGVLYVGLMIEDERPRLVEYNVRLGDPEAQVIAVRLGAQLLDLFLACAEARLDQARVQWADDHALTVVMAAEGYPGPYPHGVPLEVPEAGDPRVQVFHAGTARTDRGLVTAGGRVLSVTARGPSLREARDLAYAMVGRIGFPGGHFRRDIGARALGDATPPAAGRLTGAGGRG
jgi:phosphoribosylamine--glycine ligase